jgi:hypothetical protein
LGGVNDSHVPTDYDRACAIEGYLGLIDVGVGTGLVLDDEPMQTSFLPVPQQKGVILIRWEWANDEGAILRELAEIQEELWNQTDLSFGVNEGVLVLFDAACSGQHTGDSLELSLTKGEYSIATAHFQPDNETSLVLHRMTRR